MQDMDGILLEACCVDSAQALAAKNAGAGRIELCEDIAVGGVTPSAANIVATIAVGLPVNVLVRPRGGDFVYSADEIYRTRESVLLCAELGASGVVIGALTGDGRIDVDAIRPLVELAHAKGLSVTFHRAFDECTDPFEGLEQIISMGCDRLLTSGQKSSAYEGRELIAKLVEQAAGRIVIMPGAGITSANLGEICRATSAVEFHGTRICL